MSGHGHDTTRHVLITAGERDAGVVVLRTRHRFDAVGDDLS